MASLGTTFDPTTIPEDQKSFDPVPYGDYLVQAIETDIMHTKAGTGQRLTLILEIMDGPHAGRKVWEGINIANPSIEAQRIGQRELADLCLSMGLSSVQDSDELIGRPFRVRIGIQPAKGEYGPRNVVKRWNIVPSKVERAQAAAPAAAAQGGRAPMAGPTPTKAAAGGADRNAYAAAKGGARPWASR